MSARPLRVVGHPVPRVDALEKVTGRARYVTDLTFPGMAHAKVLRSPYAHARVRRVDVDARRARAGVFAALAGADLTWCDPYYGPAYRDRPVLAIDVARYEGEPVAAVAAVDEATAEEALELIDVDYEPLAAVMTLEEALASSAPLVHAGQPPAGHFADLSTLEPRLGTNICHQFAFARGDAASALAAADVVVEDAYRFPPVQHVALEPHAVVAAWDETGALTLWASTQNPYSVRVELAKMFDVPLARIRVVVPHLGGGFGSKTYAKLEPLAATLARAAGRPVRLAASVPEAFQTVRRCASRVAMRARVPPRRHARGSRMRRGLRRRRLRGHRAARRSEGHLHGDRSVPRRAREARRRAPSTRTRRRAARSAGSACRSSRGRSNRSSTWRRDRLDARPGRPEASEPSRPRRGVRAGRHADRRQARGEPEPRRRGDRLEPDRRGRPRARRGGDAQGASVAPSVSEAIVRLHADGSVTVLASAVEMGQGRAPCSPRSPPKS